MDQPLEALHFFGSGSDEDVRSFQDLLHHGFFEFGKLFRAHGQVEERPAAGSATSRFLVDCRLDAGIGIHGSPLQHLFEPLCDHLVGEDLVSSQEVGEDGPGVGIQLALFDPVLVGKIVDELERIQQKLY